MRHAAAVLTLLPLLAGPLRAQCPDGTPPPCRSARIAPRAPATNSVAVLYFDNASRDTADQYLADGITEEITTSLARVTRLTVMSPSVVRRAQLAGDGDPERVSRMLGVRHMVEGSVRRSGGQARITARLIGPDGRTTLWTDAYTRPTSDLLGLEEEIARQVASGVVGTLLPDERRSLAVAAVNPEAHDRVLRGNFQLARRTPQAIRAAIAEYQAAVAIDTGYAVAWGRLALAHSVLRYWSGLTNRSTEAESMLTRGERAVSRSLALDSNVAEAWLALGYLRVYRDPVGMRGMLDAFRRAVQVAPNSGEAHHQLGTGYGWQLDFEHERTELLRALELEPGRLVTLDNLSMFAFFRRDAAEALRWSDSAIAIDSSHNFTYAMRPMALAMQRDTAAALRALAAADARGRSIAAPFPRCPTLALLKLADARASCLATLDSARTPLDSAGALAALGEPDRAMDALDAARAQGAPWLWMVQSLPQFDTLRTNARFRRLVETLRPVDARQP